MCRISLGRGRGIKSTKKDFKFICLTLFTFLPLPLSLDFQDRSSEFYVADLPTLWELGIMLLLAAAAGTELTGARVCMQSQQQRAQTRRVKRNVIYDALQLSFCSPFLFPFFRRLARTTLKPSVTSRGALLSLISFPDFLTSSVGG